MVLLTTQLFIQRKMRWLLLWIHIYEFKGKCDISILVTRGMYDWPCSNNLLQSLYWKKMQNHFISLMIILSALWTFHTVTALNHCFGKKVFHVTLTCIKYCITFHISRVSGLILSSVTVCVDFLMFSLCLHGFPLCFLVSTHHPKTWW